MKSSEHPFNSASYGGRSPFLQVDNGSEGGMPSNTVDNAILDKGSVFDEASPGLFFLLAPVEYITFFVGSRSTVYCFCGRFNYSLCIYLSVLPRRAIGTRPEAVPSHAIVVARQALHIYIYSVIYKSKPSWISQQYIRDHQTLNCPPSPPPHPPKKKKSHEKGRDLLDGLFTGPWNHRPTGRVQELRSSQCVARRRRW